MVTTIRAESGKVDSLNPEQEAKVKETWQRILDLWQAKADTVGRLSDKNGSLPRPPLRTSSVRSTTSSVRIGDTARKVRKFGLVRRTASRASSMSTIDSTEGQSSTSHQNDNYATVSIDDKYGLSKDLDRKLADLTSEQIRRTFWNMVKQDNPDALIVRYLRACKWDMGKALAMLISSIHWRCEVRLDDLMQKGDTFAHQRQHSRSSTERREASEFLRQVHVGKAYIHGLDRWLRPIIYIQVHHHKPIEQSNKSLEQFIAYISELSILMKVPQQESVVLVFNLSHFTIANMVWLCLYLFLL